MLRSLLLAATLAFAGAAQAAGIGYLGPAGSWTHEACADLFGEADLVPLPREALFADCAFMPMFDGVTASSCPAVIFHSWPEVRISRLSSGRKS